MELKEIEALVRLFERSSLTEMVVEQGGFRLTLKREGQGLRPHPSSPKAVKAGVEAEVEADEPSPRTKAGAGAGAGEEGLKEPEDEVGDRMVTVVRSPMVGVFHRRPGPGEDPFVEVGTRVKEGDILGLIEAMKVLTEVRAADEGIVEKIMVEDGEPVEYGQELILIRQL